MQYKEREKNRKNLISNIGQFITSLNTDLKLIIPVHALIIFAKIQII